MTVADGVDAEDYLVTVSVSGIVCVTPDAFVPVIVSENVPCLFPAVMVRVEVAPGAGVGVTGCGLKLAVTPFGNPLTLRVTAD